MTDIKKTLITSALPYINGIKHLGNLAGSLLPADIHARYRRRANDHHLLQRRRILALLGRPRGRPNQHGGCRGDRQDAPQTRHVLHRCANLLRLVFC